MLVHFPKNDWMYDMYQPLIGNNAKKAVEGSFNRH